MPTVLVVEDSVTDREHLTECLEANRVSVISAQSSEEAKVMLQSSLPDLICLDVILPGKSGFEFCKDLKMEQHTQDIPVILCSIKGTEADQLWGSMLGAEAYLTKPIDQQHLIETVNRLIKLHRR